MVEELAPRPPEQAEPHRELPAKAAKPSATLRRSPRTSWSDEIPAYAAERRGGAPVHHHHASVDLTTLQAVRASARRSRGRRAAAGFAGMKDKRAVTTQTISLPFTRNSFARRSARALARRHHHFVAPPTPPQAQAGAPPGAIASPMVLRDIATRRGLGRDRRTRRGGRGRGVPNAFGPQRFGRDGNNVRTCSRLAQRALERAQRQARGAPAVLGAAVRVLQPGARRRLEIEGTWNRPLAGDLIEEVGHRRAIFYATIPRSTENAPAAKKFRLPALSSASRCAGPKAGRRKLRREILVNGPRDQKIRSTNTEIWAKVRGAPWCSSSAISGSKKMGNSRAPSRRICATEGGLRDDGARLL